MPSIYVPPDPLPNPEPPPDTSGLVTAAVYQLPDPRSYAVEQERMRHNQALYAYGEYAMFALMWTIRDLEHGRVQRCSRCFEDVGLNDRIADTYKQANLRLCPVCFGTSFEGGYRALIIRPSLWDFSEDADA